MQTQLELALTSKQNPSMLCCIVCHETFSTIISSAAICSLCEQKPLPDVLRIYEQKRQEIVNCHSDLSKFELVHDSYFVKNIKFFIANWPGRLLNINRNDLYGSKHSELLKHYILQRMLFLNQIHSLQKVAQTIQRPIRNRCEPYSNIRLNDLMFDISQGNLFLQQQQTIKKWKSAVDYYNQTFFENLSLPSSLIQVIYSYAPICQCKCSYANVNFSPMKIKLGCEFMACDDHLTCSCCYDLKCCGKKRCQLCIMQCVSCAVQMCPVCKKRCNICNDCLCRRCTSTIVDKGTYVEQLICLKCDVTISQKQTTTKRRRK